MARDQLTIVYVIGIFVAGAFAATAALMWLRALRYRRRAQLAQRVRFEAVHTKTPIENSENTARQRALESIDKTSTVTRRLVLPLTLLIVLFVAGIPFIDQVPATVFSLLVAAVTVVIGIAARPVVENAIAGLVISSSRILNIGDTVRISGHYGTVEDITVTHTTVKIWDWRRFVIPNSAMLQREFENYSLFDRHIWAHVEFWVDHDAELVKVEALAVTAPLESEYYIATEAPKFWVMQLDKDAVHCWVAAWAKTPADAWGLTHDMRVKLSTLLRDAGIGTHKTVWKNQTSA